MGGMPVLYSRAGWRRARQVSGDLWLVLWTALWIWIAVRLHELIMGLAAPGLAVADGAANLAGTMDDAQASAGQLPLVGSVLGAPFGAVGDASRSLEAAGLATADAVSKVALFASISLAVLAFASFAAFWLPIRIAFIRKAASVNRIVQQENALDLLALRALVRQPLRVVAGLGPDVAGAWRAGDQGAIRALADLELRADGVRLPGS
jgi:hypothetical protein